MIRLFRYRGTGLGLVLTLLLFPFGSDATTFKLEIDSPTTLTIRCSPDYAYQQEDYLFLFQELKQAFDRLGNEALQTSIFTENNAAGTPHFVLRVTNIALLQDTLNFFDYSYSRSFYREKYNLRLTLNARLFQSDFFRQLAARGFSFERFRPLFAKENLVFLISLPGHCQRTNLERYNHSYYVTLPESLFRQEGKLVYIETAHFFPEIYLTVLLGMAIAVALLLFSLLGNATPAKFWRRFFPPFLKK